MGFYSDYLNRGFSDAQLANERKKQLQRISRLRGNREIMVYAADLNKVNPQTSPLTTISYVDILSFSDQLANLTRPKLDLILETPGGSAEVAEDLVRQLRQKYDDIAVIVPGWAKSAGTLMAMAADEILMGPTSSLGPIDAQLFWQGKSFSADALLEGLNKIKKEVGKTLSLNKAYIPILQGISPGEIQGATNALKFSKTLVTDWLVSYKFKNWKKHSSSGSPVTDEERKERAERIADRLCNHGLWLTHGRSIKLNDLREMGLQINDYSEKPSLSEAITRYYTLLQMTFAGNIYKIYETPNSQILKFLQQKVQQINLPAQAAESGIVDMTCSKCKNKIKIQANFVSSVPLGDDCIPFPNNDKVKCPRCAEVTDISQVRKQIELQAKRPLVF